MKRLSLSSLAMEQISREQTSARRGGDKILCTCVYICTCTCYEFLNNLQYDVTGDSAVTPETLKNNDFNGNGWDQNT